MHTPARSLVKVHVLFTFTVVQISNHFPPILVCIYFPFVCSVMVLVLVCSLTISLFLFAIFYPSQSLRWYCSSIYSNFDVDTTQDMWNQLNDNRAIDQKNCNYLYIIFTYTANNIYIAYACVCVYACTRVCEHVCKINRGNFDFSTTYK